MKAAVLRPRALRDQQSEARYYPMQGGTRVAVQLVRATNGSLDQIELEPGTGSSVEKITRQTNIHAIGKVAGRDNAWV